MQVQFLKPSQMNFAPLMTLAAPRLLPLLFVVTLLATSAAMAGGKSQSTDRWTSSHHKEHPLVGTIWNAKGAAVKPAELQAAVVQATYVLLGETHPNPDHHHLQTELLQAIVATGRRPAVVFEMVPHSMQAKLDAFLKSGPADAATLGGVLRWSERGWPAWDMYRPIFAAAHAAKLNILAGGIERGRLKKISREETFARLANELNLNNALTDKAVGSLERNIKTAHCDLLPAAALKPVVRIQRARDMYMTKAMLSAERGQGAVLIAGSGHARRDWGAGKILLQNAPDAKVVAIRFVEVVPEKRSVAEYSDKEDGLQAPFDYLYFTPRSDLTDHCAKLAKHMKARRSKPK